MEAEFGQQNCFSCNRGGETNAWSTPRCRTTQLTISTFNPPLLALLSERA